ncbi:MAG: hypothetical protein L0Y44_00890, partial [Phycisphaerales bacterium]|nr:hypothetical protein [Phycisphaerales bacterium]
PTTGTGGGIFAQNGQGQPVAISNSIFWDNTATGLGKEIRQQSAPVNVTYSDVRNRFGAGVSGTINWGSPDTSIGENLTLHNPDFMDAGAGNYRLQCSSPCKDTGLDESVPADGQDVNEDGDVDEATVDLDLTKRIIPDNAGNPTEVDMGAYERACPGDFNEDGTNNVEDLLALISGWGTAGPTDIAPAPCGDGVTNVTDLLYLIGLWGPLCNVITPPPQSVEDCKDRCAGAYELGSEDWAWCTDECIADLCQQQVIICD